MIETISSQAQMHGSETSHGTGAFGRGGSQNAEGITMIDYLTEGSQPFQMVLAYDNIAIL